MENFLHSGCRSCLLRIRGGVRRRRHEPIAHDPASAELHIVPSTGLLQLLYDGHRNLLYALKSTEVDVLNPAPLRWQSPITFPAAAANGVPEVMALSPDGSKLVVEEKVGSSLQFIILDPSGAANASVVPIRSRIQSRL